MAKMKISGIGKKPVRKKILVRLTLIMILLSVVSGAIILSVILNEQKGMMEKNLIEENKQLSSVATRSIEAGIFMLPLLKEINNSENVLFCWVVKPEGIIHLADDLDMSGKRAEGVPLEAEETVVKDYVFKGENIKLIVQPFRIGEPEKTWELCTGISLKSVNEAVNRMIVTSLSFFFLIIAFAFGLSFLLAKRFTKPITQLVEGTKTISRGDFDSQVKIKTGDELEELGNAFNSMAQQLKKVISLEKEKTAREYIENVVNTMGETLVVVDSKGEVKRANKAIFDLLGYGEEEVVGKSINKFLHQKEAREKLKMVKGSDGESFESTFSTRDGREIPVILSVSPIKGEDGEPEEIVCVGTNITKRKQAEEELERANRDLEDFTSTVSHDLRAPLRSIQAFSMLLMEDYASSLDETGRDYLNKVKEAVERMSVQIEDLLTLSRVGRKFIEVETVDMNELLEEIKTDLSARIGERGGEVVVGKLPPFSTQRVWMKELFTNLIDNGLKFNRAEKPRIEVSCEEREQDYLFKVRDNGIGIEEKHQTNIFSLFERLHSQSEYEGTGAGLAICKKIVEELGGTIWVESNPGEGSTFFFTMPRI